MVASAGSFPYGNTGKNVTWEAPDEPSTELNDIWIKVTVEDEPLPPDPYEGTRDDPAETETIHVTVVKADLDIAGTTEETEETLGGFVAVNDDDDDDDDVVDTADAGSDAVASNDGRTRE